MALRSRYSSSARWDLPSQHLEVHREVHVSGPVASHGRGGGDDGRRLRRCQNAEGHNAKLVTGIGDKAFTAGVSAELEVLYGDVLIKITGLTSTTISGQADH